MKSIEKCIGNAEASKTAFKGHNRSDKISTKFLLAVKAFLSIPKTLYFNFKCFSLKTALKFPVLVSYETKILELHKGMIRFGCNPERFMVKIGFGGSDGIIEHKNFICLESGFVKFEGKASFSAGISLRNAGELTFGNGFWSNKNCTIWCSNKIVFGENVLLGWNVLFRDSDGHLIIDNGTERPVDGEIVIGNHCWICSETHILKNSGLGNDCILGYGSILTKNYNDHNILCIGIPAKPIKNNINWERGD